MVTVVPVITLDVGCTVGVVVGSLHIQLCMSLGWHITASLTPGLRSLLEHVFYMSATIALQKTMRGPLAGHSHTPPGRVAAANSL